MLGRTLRACKLVAHTGRPECEEQPQQDGDNPDPQQATEGHASAHAWRYLTCSRLRCTLARYPHQHGLTHDEGQDDHNDLDSEGRNKRPTRPLPPLKDPHRRD